MLKEVETACEFTKEQIKDEPMFWRADWHYTTQNCGPLGDRVMGLLLRHLVNTGRNHMTSDLLIDTRVNMLKPGWYPSIPGWHCDALVRDATGRVLLENICDRENTNHFLYVFDSGTGSLTEFLESSDEDLGEMLTDIEVEASDKNNVWYSTNEQIKTAVEIGDLKVKTIKPDTLYEFDAMEYHRTTPATGSGYRYFFRASYIPRNRVKVENQIRKQVNTYVPNPDFGW